MVYKKFDAFWSEWSACPNKKVVGDGVLVQALYLSEWGDSYCVHTATSATQNWTGERVGPFSEYNMVSYRYLVVVPTDKSIDEQADYDVEMLMAKYGGKNEK